jgi:hypothetical protein
MRRTNHLDAVDAGVQHAARGLAVLSGDVDADGAALPANSRRRTSVTAAGPAGFNRSRASPAHTVSSFSCNRSSVTPPKTMAPSRPFPIGGASFHAAAGCRYQSRSGVRSAARPGCGERSSGGNSPGRIAAIVQTAASTLRRRRLIGAEHTHCLRTPQSAVTRRRLPGVGCVGDRHRHEPALVPGPGRVRLSVGGYVPAGVFSQQRGRDQADDRARHDEHGDHGARVIAAQQPRRDDRRRAAGDERGELVPE